MNGKTIFIAGILIIIIASSALVAVIIATGICVAKHFISRRNEKRCPQNGEGATMLGRDTGPGGSPNDMMPDSNKARRQGNIYVPCPQKFVFIPEA